VYAEKGSFVSLADKNRQADRAFLDWTLDSVGSSLPEELKTVFTSEARSFMVQEAQFPFKGYLTREQRKEKVKQARKEFEKRYGLEGKPWRLKRILTKLIEELIAPEYVFQATPDDFDPLDKPYNELIETLSHYGTTQGTTLKEWALSFLTSESQFVALSILKRETVRGNYFKLLADSEQVRLLAMAGEVLTRRFMHNLQVAREKYHFKIPPHFEMSLKKRINQFLFEKFSP
jgi:hypothetical protein